MTTRTSILLIVALASSAGCKKKENVDAQCDAIYQKGDGSKPYTTDKAAFIDACKKVGSETRRCLQLKDMMDDKACAPGKGNAFREAMALMTLGQGVPTPPPPAAGSAAPEAAPPAAEPAAATAKPGATGMPDCDEFVALTEKYLKCDKVTPEIRDNQTKALEMQRPGWAALATAPEDRKKQANDICKENVGFLKKTATDAGCPL